MGLPCHLAFRKHHHKHGSAMGGSPGQLRPWDSEGLKFSNPERSRRVCGPGRRALVTLEGTTPWTTAAPFFFFPPNKAFLSLSLRAIKIYGDIVFSSETFSRPVLDWLDKAQTVYARTNSPPPAKRPAPLGGRCCSLTGHRPSEGHSRRRKGWLRSRSQKPENTRRPRRIRKRRR